MLAIFLPVFVTPDWNFSMILVLLSSWKLMLGDSHEHPSHHLPYCAITKNCYLTVSWLIAPNTVPSNNQSVCTGFKDIAETDTATKTLPATENRIYLRLPALDFSFIWLSWLWQLLRKLKFPFRHQQEFCRGSLLLFGTWSAYSFLNYCKGYLQVLVLHAENTCTQLAKTANNRGKNWPVN